MNSVRSRVVVAINPAAAFGRHLAVGAVVVDAVTAAGYEAVAVSAANVELLRRDTKAALRDDDRALVVVGGDGMVSLGVNLVAGTSVPLGIVATGTGNDTARALGLPYDDTDAAVRALVTTLSRPPRIIDAGRVCHGEVTTWFAGAVSAGFDAIVNERANRMSWPRGASKYMLAMVRELLTLKPIEYELVVDGVARNERALLITVANGNSIGGGMRIVPHAHLDDGLLDLFIVSPMRRLAFLRVFPKVFSGTHTELDEVHISRVSSVRINAGGIVAMADGERLGALPVEIDIVPGALRVLAPIFSPPAAEDTS